MVSRGYRLRRPRTSLSRSSNHPRLSENSHQKISSTFFSTSAFGVQMCRMSSWQAALSAPNHLAGPSRHRPELQPRRASREASREGESGSRLIRNQRGPELDRHAKATIPGAQARRLIDDHGMRAGPSLPSRTQPPCEMQDASHASSDAKPEGDTSPQLLPPRPERHVEPALELGDRFQIRPCLAGQHLQQRHVRQAGGLGNRPNAP